jgi:hypothetical protein
MRSNTSKFEEARIAIAKDKKKKKEKKQRAKRKQLSKKNNSEETTVKRRRLNEKMQIRQHHTGKTRCGNRKTSGPVDYRSQLDMKGLEDPEGFDDMFCDSGIDTDDSGVSDYRTSNLSTDENE